MKIKKTSGPNGDFGIWHETYWIAAGQYEAIYNNMTAFGMGKAGKLVPASGHRSTAAGRLAGQEAPPAPVEAGTAEA